MVKEDCVRHARVQPDGKLDKEFTRLMAAEGRCSPIRSASGYRYQVLLQNMAVGLALSCVRRVIQNVNMCLWIERDRSVCYCTQSVLSLYEAYTNNPEEGPDELSKRFIWPGTRVGVKAIGEGCFPLLFLVVDAKIKVRVD